MELRQLVTFRLAATTLSFTRTAAALNYAQSSVTAQIQALEEEMGAPLFNRLGRRLALTEAGRRLLEYAEKILDLAEEAHTAVSQPAEPAGTLTISAPETLCTYRLPAVLQRYRARYPGVRLIFRPSPAPDLLTGVVEGSLDVAFILEGNRRATNLEIEALMPEPLALIAPPDHRLAGRSIVRPADLQGETFLLTEAGCGYRMLFERAMARSGVHLATPLEFASVEAIKQCVASSLGISVLPAVAVARELEEGRLVALPWIEKAFQVTSLMVWHRDGWRSPALEAFLAMARETLGAGSHDVLAAS